MYSGTTLTRISGNIIGAHQKIDRIARRQLESMLPGLEFPEITNILHFEGNQGPDSTKRKSPAHDEEWHYIQPFDDKDTQLIDFINLHYKELVKALKSTNQERAAFEAAWLSHAIVDGLTPAHHYPYEQKLMELRNGEGLETRTTVKAKLVMPGDTRSHAIKNNWKMWGPKGLFTTHAAFEMGFATLIAPLSFTDIMPATDYVSAISKQHVGPWFRSVAQQIVKLNLYDTFYETGWTMKLSGKLTKELAPTLINAVTAAWYCAYEEANPKHKS
ncbi:MAG: hypothetical protein WDN66_05510 [Candidatus Saccharibacteria bacterium]